MKNKNEILMILAALLLVMIFVLIALCFFYLLQTRSNPPQEPGSSSDDENRDSAPLTTQEMKSERREKILTSILRKKVRSKSNAPVLGNHGINDTDNEVALLEDEDIDFPHEYIMALRSIHSSMSITWHDNNNNGKTTGTRDNNDAVTLASVVPSRAGNSTHRMAVGVFGNKNDILIETLQSIRSNLNITSDHSNKSSIYSPKTCPVCFGDYVKGDDIAWSKNEKCCHAFHTDCILEWLMNHDECPMCRNDYLQETEEA